MRLVKTTQESIPRLIECVRSWTHVYGVDVVECGIQDLQIAFLQQGLSYPNVLLAEMEDDDGELLSMGAWYFAETLPVAIFRSAYNTKLGLTRYPSLVTAKAFINQSFNWVLERGVTELYWANRVGRARQMENILAEEMSPGNVMDGWGYRVYEHIEPFERAKNELLGMYLLGPLNGIVPKPLVINQVYQKNAYRKNQ